MVRDILDGVDDVHFSQLTSTDVVRHRLVSDIVDAYARFDAATDRHTLDRRAAHRPAAGPHARPPPLTAASPTVACADGPVGGPVGWPGERACELTDQRSSAANAADERSEEGS